MAGVTASFAAELMAEKAMVGGSSSSVIVTVWAGIVPPITTLSGVPDIVITNFSLFSSNTSSTITAEIVVVVFPAVIFKESLAKV